jgi:hypothetical protein
MVGEAGAARGGGERPVLPALFSTGREKKAGWTSWAKKAKHAGGVAGPTGLKSKEKIFLE